MKNLLCGKEIVKSFGEGNEKTRVLNQVSLEVERGEYLSVMGPSGSGKSTLLYALSGMDIIDNGSVSLDGLELSGLEDEALSDLRRRKMGFVFQQPALLRNLNILDNIILPMMRDNRKQVGTLVQKAKTLMRLSGIEGLEEREITQMSGGQLQRAGICRALMADPDIIFGDEPTGALNSKAAQEILDLFDQIQKAGTAILLVTHDVQVAARTNRVLFMQDGRIVSELRFQKEKLDYKARAEQVMVQMRRVGI